MGQILRCNTPAECFAWIRPKFPKGMMISNLQATAFAPDTIHFFYYAYCEHDGRNSPDFAPSLAHVHIFNPCMFREPTRVLARESEQARISAWDGTDKGAEKGMKGRALHPLFGTRVGTSANQCMGWYGQGSRTGQEGTSPHFFLACFDPRL